MLILTLLGLVKIQICTFFLRSSRLFYYIFNIEITLSIEEVDKLSPKQHTDDL